MTFARPPLLALVLLLPLVVALALYARRRQQRVAQQFGTAHLIAVLIAPKPHPRILRTTSELLALCCLIVAAAGPHWGRDRSPSTLRGRDIALILDMSRSMDTNDMATEPSRWQAGRSALVRLVEHLQTTGGHRAALIVFAGRAKVIAPLTHDLDHIREQLIELRPHVRSDLQPMTEQAVSGTRIGLAIESAVSALIVSSARHSPSGYQDILLVSDGDDPATDEEWRNGIRAARAAGVPVHTVAVGDPLNERPIDTDRGKVVSRPNVTLLDELALQTHGKYLASQRETPDLIALFRTHLAPTGDRSLDVNDVRTQVDRSHIFLLLALALLTFTWVNRE